MITDRMRALIERIEHLPAETQDQLAEQIAATLEERHWQELLTDPARLARLRALAEEAMEDEVLPFPQPAQESNA
ncbi:MAG TPA: hypothetical protein VFY89_06485, partial [Ktedonobacterales bacterium]